MNARQLLTACCSTSGLPEPSPEYAAIIATLTPEQCELVALMVAAAYSNGARDAGAEQ